MDKKKSGAFLAKEKVVAEIEGLIRGAKSMVFVDYAKTNVAEITKLRNKFRPAGVTYKVYKNNLMRIALNNCGITALDDKLAGTLAVAFSNNDEISGAKLIAGEKFKDKMAFKFGLLGQEILDASGVQRLASIPSKEVLIVQIMGMLQNGARGLACVMNERAKQLGA